MLNTSFAPWPSYTNKEIDAVRDVLLSNRVNYWTGEESRLFEQEFAEWLGCKYAIALANGYYGPGYGYGYGSGIYVNPGYGWRGRPGWGGHRDWDDRGG